MNILRAGLFLWALLSALVAAAPFVFTLGWAKRCARERAVLLVVICAVGLLAGSEHSWATRFRDVTLTPHRLDLLMRANTAAMRMLSHSLREAAEAGKLEQAQPEPRLIERFGRYRHSLTNVAACIAILFLTKAGIFSSFHEAHTRGQAALKQYYANQAGEDVAREIFGA